MQFNLQKCEPSSDMCVTSEDSVDTSALQFEAELRRSRTPDTVASVAAAFEPDVLKQHNSSCYPASS